MILNAHWLSNSSHDSSRKWWFHCGYIQGGWLLGRLTFGKEFLCFDWLAWNILNKFLQVESVVKRFLVALKIILVACDIGPWLTLSQEIHCATTLPTFIIHHTLWVIKVNLLSHTHPHKPLRESEMATCNHQVDSPFYLWPYVCSGNNVSCLSAKKRVCDLYIMTRNVLPETSIKQNDQPTNHFHHVDEPGHIEVLSQEISILVHS